MKYLLCINYELIISITAIIIAIIAMFFTYLSFRYQIISMIHSQLSEKAKEANSYLNLKLEFPTNERHKISLILASIITARQILKFQLKKYCYLNIGKTEIQSFIHIFHLQLNTEIRSFIGNLEEMDAPNPKDDLYKHHKEAYDFLKVSIKKYDKSSI